MQQHGGFVRQNEFNATQRTASVHMDLRAFAILIAAAAAGGYSGSDLGMKNNKAAFAENL